MGKLVNLKQFERGVKVINKSPTTAEIRIYEQIGESFWEDGLSAKSFDDQLKELPSSVQNIEVRLNSPGGDVFQGLTIYNRLKQHKAKVTVYIDGLAASIASIIALAGDEVIMGEGALMMIHKASTGVWGNVDDFIKTIEVLDEIDEQLVSIYFNKCRKYKSRAEIKNMMAETTWINAEEALEMGLVDTTMAQDEEMDIAACLGEHCKWIKTMPKLKNHSEDIRKKIEDKKKEIEDFLAR
jgi:ATP-dependent protease ClpP protease subunit